jgi:hypothetical protein
MSAYSPYDPARRPGGSPSEAPSWRVLVHRQFQRHYDQLVERVGIQAAQRLWDYLATAPDQPPPVGNTTLLRGQAGKPKGPGWSRVVHYELSSMARVDFHYNRSYKTSSDGDEHRVVAILTINYSSH